MFENRKDAGEKLARALEKYKDKDALVLAIPRGGVEVGYHVAKHINAELAVMVSRKLPYPDNPEAGFGAIAEDGSLFIFEDALGFLSKEEIDKIIEQQKTELKRRVAVFRKNEPLPEIKDRIVILVDDGVAMGSTMRASIKLCRNKKAKKVVVAAPVSGGDVARQLEKEADEAVILEKPVFFQAVAQVYMDWYDVPDAQVLEIMKKWRGEQKIGPFS
ncbi:MAG: phosphoribosyltransferase [Candidatus Omnitrophica bacterium]|nr:phosphoribosyltransferase [Candidatus Omnitrophota bacterium]